MQSLMPPIDSPNNLFSDGNPSTGALGTVVPALWMNNVQASIRALQRELLTILNVASINPDGDNSAQVLEAINKIINNSTSGVPYGVPLPWPTNTPPEGYLLCNGAAFSASIYPNLSAVYPGNTTPDMRNQTIKGLPSSGRALLSLEADNVKSHSHTATVISTDLGTIASSSYNHGTVGTSSNGTHSHTFDGKSGDWRAENHFPADGANGGTYSVETSQAGDHTHVVNIGSHSHTTTLGSHSHGITVNATGNAENTVKNIAFNYIVRAL